MNKKILWVYATAIFLCHEGYADINIGTNTYNQETLENALEQEQGRPFSIEISGDRVSKAKFEHELIDHQEFGFRELDIDASMVVYYTKCYEEAILLGVGYNLTNLDWDENPFFERKDFHTVSFAVGMTTQRLNNWLWLGKAGINIDANHFNFSQYAYYEFLAWGRYTYRDDIGLHVGILFETGMKIDRVYPILGIDWLINDCWKLNLVFPTNMSVVYAFDECWSLALAGRVFDQRERLANSEPLPKGLWTYRASGVELALSYDCDDWIVANAHVGTTFGGVLKIANRHYEEKRRLRFKGSTYIGGEIAIKF